MENTIKYFSEIVYLRAIAILAVISIHVSKSFTEMSSITFLTLLYMSLDTFSHFAVPLFVCISGFVLYNKYKGQFLLKPFYKKRLMSVLPQYIVFSLVGVLLSFVVYTYVGSVGNFDVSIPHIILTVLDGTAFYHLWFFFMIIQLYILYPFIEKVFTKSVENHTTLGLLIFLLIVQIVYQISSIDHIFFIGIATNFLPYTFYFVLGMYFRSHYLNYTKMVITPKHVYILFFTLLCVTILGIECYSLEYFSNVHIPQIITVYNGVFAIVLPFYNILIFIVCLYFALKISEMMPNRITKWLQIIGSYSFGIYLIHAFILFVLTTVILPEFGFDMNNWLFFPIVFTLVLSLSVLFVYILSKVPYHEYVIGSLR